MATQQAAPSDTRATGHETAAQESHNGRGNRQATEQKARPLLRFWTKINNDWVFNLSGTLAYSFLMSIFPILLVILAIAGLVVSQQRLIAGFSSVLPNGASSGIIQGVTDSFKKSTGLLFIIGVVLAVFNGSRLFITLESCFGIIFRLRSRNLIRQNLMAVGMMLLFTVLIPIVFLATTISQIIVKFVFPAGNAGVAGLLIRIAGYATALLVGMVLFGAIYVVVPNRKVALGEVWKGTLFAALLLVIYEIVFPLYESFFLHPNNLGSLAGFAIVILVFFYYLAFILLLGAEVNSWMQGQRETAGDLAALLHEVQAHDSTRGVAGPTAGQPQEDLMSGLGAAAMRDTPSAVRHEREDHKSDVQPPKYAEAGQPDGPAGARPRTPEKERETEQVKRELEGKHEPTPQSVADDASAPPAADQPAAPAMRAAITTTRTPPAPMRGHSASRPITPLEARQRQRRTFASLAATTSLAAITLLAQRLSHRGQRSNRRLTA